MNIIINEIKKSKENNELLGFYFNEDNLNSFNVGYVDKIDDNIIRIKAISPEGLKDGYILRRISDIVKIEKSSIYLKKVKKLIKDLEYLKKNIEINEISEEDLLTDTLKYVHEKILLATFYFEEGKNILTGYLKEISEDEILISVINEYGQEDGEQIINIDIMDQVDINSIDNRKIELMLD